MRNRRQRSPPPLSTKFPPCSVQPIALGPRPSTGAARGHHPATPRPRRPARPRTLLFTSMVPRQPLLSPCRWPRFMLSTRPAAASSGAGPRERGQRGRGRAGSGLGAPHGASSPHLPRSALRWARCSAAARGSDWQCGRRGHGSLPGRLGGGGGRGEERAEH